MRAIWRGSTSLCLPKPDIHPHVNAMTYDAAAEMWRDINATSLGDLRAEVAAAAVRYARLRTDWWLATAEDRAQMDRSRTAAHERPIDSLNILARNMMRQGEASSWRSKLGNDR